MTGRMEQAVHGKYRGSMVWYGIVCVSQNKMRLAGSLVCWLVGWPAGWWLVHWWMGFEPTN